MLFADCAELEGGRPVANLASQVEVSILKVRDIGTDLDASLRFAKRPESALAMAHLQPTGH